MDSCQMKLGSMISKTLTKGRVLILLPLCLCVASCVSTDEQKSAAAGYWIQCDGHNASVYNARKVAADVTVTWTGKSRSGKTHGYGILTWKLAGKEVSRYTGEMRRGVKEGRGTVNSANGSRYIGAFRNGKRDGTGTYYWAAGDSYSGQWRAGRRHGSGVFTSTRGSLIGLWRNDKYVGTKSED